ncbi:T9SS type A sorting domain-containing protein [uncultured Muribaculum sp.]|uniref:T9SS type A sorting domain-containing protein n=1 Tax=uncultured Muribaculum sp. TaxID=1918613 RepID=UPI002639D298|nr:T9SS type A sorting domain-containing protein [uncultured Muribaculum sp.]
MKLNYSKTAAFALFALLAAGVSHADDKLVVSGAAGSQTGVSISDISRISFDGGRMIVTTSTGDTAYDLGDIDKISFDLATSALDDIEVPMDDITVAVSGGVLTVKASSDVPLSVDVYNLRGVLVSSQRGSDQISVDFNAMASGIYIVKANDKTIKFTR